MQFLGQHSFGNNKHLPVHSTGGVCPHSNVERVFGPNSKALREVEPQHPHDASPEVALPDTTTVPIVEGHGLRLVEPPPEYFFEREDVSGKLPIQRPTRRAVGAPRPQSSCELTELDLVDDRGLDPL